MTKDDELRRPEDWKVVDNSGYIGMEKRESEDTKHATYTAAKRYGQRKNSRNRELPTKSVDFD